MTVCLADFAAAQKTWKRSIALWATTTLVFGAIALPAGAATLTYTDFTQAEGDQISSAGDAILALLDFDLVTGEYTATWTADSANPFNGNITLGLNLQIAPVSQSPVSLIGRFSAVPSTTTLSYSGTELLLTAWTFGDEIASAGSWNNGPFDQGGFSSVVIDDDDTFFRNRDSLFQTTAVIQSGVIPEPGTALLLGFGMVGLSIYRR